MKWIAVTERVPETRIRVNAWDGLIVEDMYLDTDGKWKYTNESSCDDWPEKSDLITHWMPLPKYPIPYDE